MDMNLKGKKLKLSKWQIIVIALCVLILIFGLIGYKSYNTPKWNDEIELKSSSFKYKGDTYTYITSYTKVYDFELDKKVASSGDPFFGYDYVTFKNDPNQDFLFVSTVGDKFIYTKADIKEEDLHNPDCEYRKILKPTFERKKGNNIKYNPNDGFYQPNK